jgi:hypothetical protein
MPPSPGSSSRAGTGARPSPDLRVCSSRSQSRSPAWDTMARWSGRPGLPISICGRIAPLGEREPPSECERATSKVPPAKEGGSRCHRSGRRRIRRQASLARRANRSRRRRPRAGSNRGRSRPAASSMRPLSIATISSADSSTSTNEQRDRVYAPYGRGGGPRRGTEVGSSWRTHSLPRSLDGGTPAVPAQHLPTATEPSVGRRCMLRERQTPPAGWDTQEAGLWQAPSLH